MRALALIALVTAPAYADSIVATRTIRAQSVIALEDIAMVAADIPGALSAPELAVGMEARVTLYAGRPVHEADVGAAIRADTYVSTVDSQSIQKYKSAP